MPTEERFTNLPFNEAIDFLRQKINLPSDRWDDYEAEVHTAFFVVAGAKGSLLSELRTAVDRAISNGQRPEDFLKDFERISEGWSHTGDKAWRANIILQTNLTQSYAAGRATYQLDPDVLKVQPYLRWIHGDSARPRPSHLALNGRVFRATELPFYPPNGWNCFPEGTKVATSEGWIPIETVRPGTLVVGGAGDLQPATFCHSRFYHGELIWISDSQERQLAVTPNHRFLTVRGWVKAANLKVGEILLQVHQLPSFDPVVADVDQRYPLVTNSKVPSPVQEPLLPGGLNTNIQIRQEYVNPVRAEIGVKNGFIPPRFNNIKQFLFKHRRFGLGIEMLLGVGSQGRNPVCFGFLSNLRIKKAAVCLQFFSRSAHTFISQLCLPIARMVDTFLCQQDTPEDFAADFLSSGVSLPLHCNSFASAAFQSKPIQKFGQGSIPTAPASAQITGSQALFDVEEPEGLFDRTPFGLFDSIDSFLDFAIRHCSTVIVANVGQMNYSGLVYDLTIPVDESYCTELGIVHNCLCRAISMTQAQVEKQGLEISDLKAGDPVEVEIDGRIYNPVLGPDKGFDRIPGQGDRREILARMIARMPPEIAKPLQEELDRIDREMAKKNAEQKKRSQKSGARSQKVKEPEPIKPPETFQDFIDLGQQHFAEFEARLNNLQESFDLDFLREEYSLAQQKVQAFRDRGESPPKKLQNKAYQALTKVSKADAQVAQVFEDYRAKMIKEGLPKAEASRLARAVEIADVLQKRPMRAYLTEFFQIFKGKGQSRLKRLMYDGPRAYASLDGQMNVGGESKKTFFHEMGHYLEFDNKVAEAAAQAWVKQRATGSLQPLKDLVKDSNYEADEVAYPDRFWSPYVGKYYSFGSTEVISMGVEKFVSAEKMRELYEADREHFLLILGITQ